MAEDYIVLQANFDEYGTVLYGCNRCGTAVFNQEMHDTMAHPVAMPFDGEDEVDLDELPEDDELPEVPEELSDPTPEVVVITPNGS